MSLNIFRDLKFFGRGRTNVVPRQTVAGFVFLLVFWISTAVSIHAQTALNGTFNVTESWSVTFIDGVGGAGYPTTYQGQESGTLNITNGQYSLIDHTAIPGGDPLNTQVHSIAGGPPYTSIGEYPFAGSVVIATNGIYSVFHLGFFSVAVFPASSYYSGPVVTSKSSVFTTIGQSLNGLSGTGSNDVENLYYFSATSRSTLVQTGGVGPTITSGPDSQTVLLGSNATFFVSATGLPAPGFQWQFNGTNIPLATLDNYTVTNAQPADQGNYSVIVSNSAGSVTSTNAFLTVSTNLAPAISVQPTNESVALGSNATLTVTASGLPTPTYQWQFNSTNITGATASSYTITNAQLSEQGDYSVIVSNSVSAVTSSNAFVTVTPGPFFADELFLGGGWYWLDQGNDTNHFFGIYTYSPQSFPVIYHNEMGWEYYVDAGNANQGAYFYDFSDGAWFYTEPAGFPNIFDFKANSWVYYQPASSYQYTSNPRWFFNYSTGIWGNHL